VKGADMADKETLDLLKQGNKTALDQMIVHLEDANPECAEEHRKVAGATISAVRPFAERTFHLFEMLFERNGFSKSSQTKASFKLPIVGEIKMEGFTGSDILRIVSVSLLGAILFLLVEQRLDRNNRSIQPKVSMVDKHE